MPAQSKTVIKSYFERGDRPTQAQFADLIDSYADIADVPSLPIPVSAGGTGATTATAARTALGAAPTASPTFTGTATAAALSVTGASTLSGLVTADNIRTSGSSGIQLQNSAGTAVLTAGSAATTNASFAGALNVGGKLNTVATASGAAGLNLPHGTAPSSPTDGDLWSTTTGFFGRVNGATVGPFGGGGAVTFLGSRTASASASLDFTSMMDESLYSSYFLVISVLRFSASSGHGLRYSTNNGSTWISGASDYNAVTSERVFSSTTVNNRFSNFSRASFACTSIGFVSGVLSLNCIIDGTSRQILSSGLITDGASGISHYAINSTAPTSPINALQISPETGTITSGTARLYGVRLS